MASIKKESKTEEVNFNYRKFNQIDGRHPLQKEVPDSTVNYHVRTRKGGKVSFFNFDLAKEMGLIPKSHPNEMTKELQEKILETFSLVIINEYDIINEIQYPEEEIRPHKYMATRYLQLQHPNKQGKTSGDGRSIWNGSVTNKGVRWDISSSGTGATCLSPATHIYGKYWETGDPSISYGCGYSEIDEGLGTLFFSEIFHKNHIETERVLGIIEFQKGIAINIRAQRNLLRPSHMFNYLKQGDFENLERMVHYYIDREQSNGVFTDVPKTRAKKLDYFLEKQTEIFASMAARLEDEYIFCWLDWDGDNILMNGGIIDYGSIRQFGLFHSDYRYDDVERYSTSIIEQKSKAKYTVQTFAQLVDFLKTGERKSIRKFAKSFAVKNFETVFRKKKLENLLFKTGFRRADVNYLIENERKTVEKYLKAFSYFERSKSKEGIHEVADGINWSAIFCMRDILREFPQLLLARGGKHLSYEDFLQVIKSSYATEEDLQMTTHRRKMITSFQKTYELLCIKLAANKELTLNQMLLELTMRSSVINKYDRVTGDSISTIVDRVLAKKPKIKPTQLFDLVEEFCIYQNFDPNNLIGENREKRVQTKFVKNMLQIVREYREGL
ncbi:conserved hypothetical protein [Halobacteriovorax marinus SJ]|uniref:Uncharacterized protein n=1 Tax=Halobacteriovorax marinus (strain ATCC BAA-682 / DSM 15412 / SJ) TaxID=862908 RepID=E1X501_HALMS|nr:hypothetical protein [Halobacteriovorax marinus]CBW27227.1 conserved hypothetical protein [Halobacteriovorax marinus SJ]